MRVGLGEYTAMGEEEAARREWEEELGPGERWAPEAWEEEEERRVWEEDGY